MKKTVIAVLVACCAGAGLFAHSFAQDAAPGLSASEAAQARQDFNGTCAACHGEDAGGGDRAPALVDNPHLRALDTKAIATIIRTGQRAMPSFAALPQAEVSRLAAWLHS